MVPLRQLCRLAILVGLMVVGAPAGAWGQGDDPPAPQATPTPPPGVGAPSGEEPPSAVAEPGASGEAQSSDSTSRVEPTALETGALTEEEVPIARRSLAEKWSAFRQAAQGLLLWDFFNGGLTVRSHARVKADGTAAWGDDPFESYYGEPDASLKLRELSLFAQGTIDHRMRYSLGFDFGADIGLAEAFVEGREQGLTVYGYKLGQFTVGFFQEPFSFERVMSGHDIALLERALPVWTFSPGNNFGYMLYNTALGQRMQWAAGFFSLGRHNEANASNSVLSVSGRVSVLPIYRNEGRNLLHLGVSYSRRDPRGGVVQYRSRPEARFVDFLVDTGEIEAGGIQLFGAEAVAVAGPLHVQSEAILSRVEKTDFGDLDLWGYYVQVGWFITGEHRSYDRGSGVFTRLAPTTDFVGGAGNVFTGRPGGALEVVGRLSGVDLDDRGLEGGEMRNLSVGLNWHLSATSVVKLNWVNSSVTDRGRANIVLLRFQYRPIPLPGWR